MENRKEVAATYDRDSKRYHRYLIDESEGVVGTIYVPKSEKIPEALVVRLRAKTDKHDEKVEA